MSSKADLCTECGRFNGVCKCDGINWFRVGFWIRVRGFVVSVGIPGVGALNRESNDVWWLPVYVRRAL